MLPPICEICGLDFRHELESDKSSGGLVRFADYKEPPEQVVGNPVGMAWFCAKHIKDAEFLSSLSQSFAVSQLLLNDSKNHQ